MLTDSFDNDLELSYDVQIEEGETAHIALVGAGSFTSAAECLAEFCKIRDSYSRLEEDTRKTFAEFSSSTFSVSPEKPGVQVAKIARAYEKAKACMQYLKAEYDGLGAGICAGLPRFPNYWARDTGWSLRGYLSMGDYGFARQVIDNFLRRQAKVTAGGATAGELPMIISGKAFLHTTTFGSADSTFLFPWAIREYVAATGDLAWLKKRWGSVSALVECGILKDIDGDGLVDHGFTGTAEKLPIRDSTWMDHIDRRKSANDVQALFYESLTIGSELAAMAGDNHNQKRWAHQAQELKAKIDREYWDAGSNYYYDTIRRDGSKDASVRPNSLVLLLTGAADGADGRARAVLERVEKEDLTAAWGVRSLSTLDPKYHPTLYHDGAVWPLVTGWAAVAELRHGRAEQGLAYVSSMADRILAENGMFAETYRGDRPEPFNSCILQAWSAGMYVHAVREMTLGLKLDMLENRVSFSPRLAPEFKDVIRFEHTISSASCKGRLQVTVDPRNEKISVALKGGWQGRRPEFSADPPYGVA
jgi:glycogen debranching enzyme